MSIVFWRKYYNYNYHIIKVDWFIWFLAFIA